MNAKHEAARTAFLLGLGTLCHLIIFASIHDAGGIAGARNEISLTGWLVLTTQAGTGALACLLLLLGKRNAGLFAAVVSVFCPGPVYVLLSPMCLRLALTGLGVCLAQGRFVLGPSEHEPVGQPTEQGDTRAVPTSDDVDLVLLANIGTVLVVLLVCGYGMAQGRLGTAAAWVYTLISLIVSMSVEFACWKPSLRRGPLAEHIVLLAAVVCAVAIRPMAFVLPLLAARQLIAAGRLWMRIRGGNEFWRYLTERPAQLLGLSFAVVIALGTILLSLPGATVSSDGLSSVDAVFTATSATCVTGLVVVDTGAAFTRFGQVVILVLIQIGGLGLMTISTFFAVLLGIRVGLRSEFAIGEMIGEQRNRTALRLLRFIVSVTAVIEAIGGLLFAFEFRKLNMPWSTSLWYGFFHSISAFCNAGFALFSDSFQRLAIIPTFPLLLSALIVLGGLGFGVLLSLVGLLRHRTRLSPYVRLVLCLTVMLAVGGTLLVWVLERNSALAGFSTRDALINAWFQAITPRTAGFNTLSLNAFRPATKLLTTFLMFVGAAPGSTGGGVKVTTLGVLLLLMRASLRGRRHVTVFGHRLPDSTVLNAAALICMSIGAVTVASLVLLATQSLPPSDVLFEAVSAFGTVGLSLGVTSSLSTAGKVVIILLMFVGRIGPLTFLVMVRPQKRPEVEYPFANVMVG